MKDKSVKLPEESTGECLHDRGFLKQIEKFHEKIGKFDYIKIKIFGRNLGFEVGRGPRNNTGLRCEQGRGQG